MYKVHVTCTCQHGATQRVSSSHHLITLACLQQCRSGCDDYTRVRSRESSLLESLSRFPGISRPPPPPLTAPARPSMSRRTRSHTLRSTPSLLSVRSARSIAHACQRPRGGQAGVERLAARASVTLARRCRGPLHFTLFLFKPLAHAQSSSYHCRWPCWRRFFSSRFLLLMKGSPNGQKSYRSG